jgi:hypothetical protein
MSSLSDSVDTSVFYGRDRNENGVSASRYDSFDDYCVNAYFHSYNYIMREGVWYVDLEDDGKFITLVEAFKHDERI